MIIKEDAIRKLIRKSLLEFKMGAIDFKLSNFKFSSNDISGKAETVVDHEIGESFNKLTDNAKEAAKKMFSIAEEIGAEKPVITSGFRTAEQQYNAMKNNWDRNGGTSDPEKAKSYLINLYSNDDLAILMHGYFLNDDAASGIDFINKNTGLSSHLRGNAFDVRYSTKKIKDVIDILKNHELVQRIIDEGDHYHVQIRS